MTFDEPRFVVGFLEHQERGPQSFDCIKHGKFSFKVRMNRSAQPLPSGAFTKAGELLMPTKNPRVMVVFDPLPQNWLKKNAEKQGISISNIIWDIIRNTYRESEDEHWVKEGEARLSTFVRKKAVSHDNAWKE